MHHNKINLQELVAKYRRLKDLIKGDELAAESLQESAVHSGSFSLRSMKVTISGVAQHGDSHAQAVLAHELSHAVQICQFPAARSMLRALHEVDRWVVLIFLTSASSGKRWLPGEAILSAISHPSVTQESNRLSEFIERSIDVLTESLLPQESGLTLLDLIEGSAYAIEQAACQTFAISLIKRPQIYTRAWQYYEKHGGRDLNTFAMLVHACLREGAVAGPRDSYFAHPVEMFEYLAAFCQYFETGDSAQGIESLREPKQPSLSAEDSYRVVDYDPILLGGRSKQRFSGHLESWDLKQCAQDFRRLVADDGLSRTNGTHWSEKMLESAERIVTRIFKSYTRGATANPNEPDANDRFIVDQFVALARQKFSQIDAEAFIWELAGNSQGRDAIAKVVTELVPNSIKVRLFDNYPHLSLLEFFTLSQRILDFESVLMLEKIDMNLDEDEDPTSWLVACCPNCPPEKCSHRPWSPNSPDRSTPMKYYGGCTCFSGLPATLNRATGKTFSELIS